MAYCLIPSLAEKFKKALVSGEINPEKLAEMTSTERRKALEKFVGKEESKNVNALFESKLLLKRQQQGFITWAKTVGGIKPELKRDIFTKIEKLDTVLSPKEKDAFLNDLVDKRLGVDVTEEESKKILELSNAMQENRNKYYDPITNKFSSKEAANKYGASQYVLDEYIKGLKSEVLDLKVSDIWKNPKKAIGDIAGMTKALKASLDDSAVFRQGWKTMLTNPVIWSKNAIKSFGDIAKELGGKDAMKSVKADIFSRENQMNGMYQKMKLAVGVTEEAYPSTLPEKIPFLKRLYKASENAYTGFLYRQRADIADRYIAIAKKTGVELDKKQLESIGKMVNSLTGRGDLGKLEPVANVVNNVFFSPRFVKANFDTLTAHQFQKGVTPFVRKQAALNLVKVIAGSSAVMATAEAMRPGSVEFDPRSADFGKIKVGDTRFDVTGGMGSLVTLFAREIAQSTKSTKTGEVSKIEYGYGKTNGLDVLYQYFENKLSPPASLAADLMRQADRLGNKLTVGGEFANLFVPLPITTYQELKSNPNAANVAIGLISDALGIATTTYSPNVPKYKKLENIGNAPQDTAYSNLDESTSTRVKAFKTQVNQKTFDQANKEFQESSQAAVNKIIANPRYQRMTEEQKQKQLEYTISQKMDEILKKYKYKEPTKAKPMNYIK